MKVAIDAEPLGVDQIVAISDGAEVELGEVARERIAASRAVVDRYVDGPDLVYGLNTGLGHMRNERVPREALVEYQPAIVAMHDGGLGEPLPARTVRAAMAVRVAGIARGGAGTSMGVADTLVAMLNAGVHPVVPRTGSVGASDLMHMAAIGLVAIGMGRAEYKGATLPGGEALERAGIAPVTLEPKDGLALVSANGMSVGHGALLVARADRAARLADVVLALSLEAARGNLSILDPAVARAKPVPGQAESAALVRAVLEGSKRTGTAPASVQDPLSFRVGPQVHGAFRESIAHLRREVEIELASADDNPLVDIESARMISNGNFHPLAMALAADALRPAIAHVGQLSDRRLNHLWQVVSQSINLSDVEGTTTRTDLQGLLLRYSSAVRYSELRSIADPVTLDIAPLDLGVEDHATNAVLAVQRGDDALELLDDLLTVELLTAATELNTPGIDRSTLGRGVAPVLDQIDGIRARSGPAPSNDLLHREVKARLYDGLLSSVDGVL